MLRSPSSHVAASVLLVGVALTALTGCTGGDTTPGPPASSASAGGAASGAAAGVDPCTLLSTDDVTAFFQGVAPDAPERSASPAGAQCSWSQSDTGSLILQYTTDPDGTMPADDFAAPAGSATVEGADRGWADAASDTALVVDAGQGVLVTFIPFGTVHPDRDAFVTLAGVVLQGLE